jgi:hypothetical protein
MLSHSKSVPDNWTHCVAAGFNKLLMAITLTCRAMRRLTPPLHRMSDSFISKTYRLNIDYAPLAHLVMLDDPYASR